MPKVVRFHSTGDAKVLQLDELPVQEPGKGEIRIKVQAIGLNRAEVIFRMGRYLESPKTPSKLGYEAAGVVEAIGPEVTGFKVGDKVSTIPAFSMGQYGVYGEVAIVPVHAVAHYPDNLTPEQATSIWMQYLTAYGALCEIGKMGKDDFVIITAASSSVGYAAIELCKLAGAKSIATTRGKSKKQHLLDAGADHVIVTDEEDLPKRVMEITGGKGARIAFDAIAGPFLKMLAEAAPAHGGIIFEYGALSMTETQYPLMLALGKCLTVRGYTLFEMTHDAKRLESAKKYIYDALKGGKLKPLIDRTFNKLEEIVQAHEYMESNQQNGKIVVKVG